MAFDEQAWIDRFVAQGGTPADGASIARRMSEVRSGNHDGSIAALMERPLSQAMDSIGAATAPQGRPPAPTPVSRTTQPPSLAVAAHPVAAKSPAADEGADLFGTAPAPAARRSSVRRVQRQAPAKRGPKPADFDAKPATQKELDLYQLSMEIDKKNAKESGEIGYMASAMIYASLPHSEIEGGFFKRRNGDMKLTIMNDPEIGLPYGKIPRLITAFLCTQAKQNAATHGPQVFLGHTQAEFMRKLGMTSRGGKNGDLTRVWDQSKRLFSSAITLIGTPESQFHFAHMNLAEKGMILWNPHAPDVRSRWESTLTLSQPFFKECCDHSVPLHMAVLHSLRSPLAIDIYVWLTYRMKSISRTTPITWAQLKWQFGSNYAETAQGERDFRNNFKKQLRAVLAVYREAKVVPTQDVLLLHPSPTHIPS